MVLVIWWQDTSAALKKGKSLSVEYGKETEIMQFTSEDGATRWSDRKFVGP